MSAHHARKTDLLRDLLKKDFPEARILSFAYDSTWLGDAPVKTTEEIGKSLLDEIKRNRPKRVMLDSQGIWLNVAYNVARLFLSSLSVTA